VSKPLVESCGLHVAVATWMGERFIDVVELNVLALIIVVDRLQTGDVS